MTLSPDPVSVARAPRATAADIRVGVSGTWSPGPDASPRVRTWPGVSVVMPVLNESRHLREAVRHVLSQDYPGELELVMALGPSRDDTDAIAAELVAADTRVRSVANPGGLTPAGLNAAVSASKHPIVARVDAHGLLAPGYLRTAVELLDSTGAHNVGGIMAAEGQTPFERAVAAAMRSPLGVGNARFHVGGEEGPAETVYLGVFRRSKLEELGGYDESLSRAQDWELNWRIRRSGGVVWFTPRLHVIYRPRATLRALARQYFDYGRWRRGVVRRHPESINIRYLAPPVTVIALAGGLALGALHRPRALILPGGYALAVLAGSAWVGRELDPPARRLLPLVIATMHAAWGVGFLSSDSELGSPAPGTGDGPAPPASPAS